MAIFVNESGLDRPVWSALTTGDRRFAEGGSLALRFPRRHRAFRSDGR